MVLAGKEMAVALPILLDRLADLRVAPSSQSFRYHPSPILRGGLLPCTSPSIRRVRGDTVVSRTKNAP
jgi:hypothetical protein